MLNDRRLKRIAQARLARQGLWIGTANRRSCEHHLVKLVEQCAVDCVIDVGANEGQFGTRMRDAGYAGPILSFEPVKEVFEVLEAKTTADVNWSAHNLAIGDSEGTLEINIAASTDLTSVFHLKTDVGLERPTWRATGSRSVPLCTIDAFLHDHNFPGRLLLKSDTQGYDLNVLAGARESLERVAALEVEVAVEPIYDGAPDYIESLTAIRDLGFRLLGMYPGGCEPPLEFDSVWARPALIQQTW